MLSLSPTHSLSLSTFSILNNGELPTPLKSSTTMVNPQHSLLTLFIFIFVTVTPSSSSSDLASSRSALLSLRSAVGGRTHLWSTDSPTPCSWSGVQCWNNTVTGLRLPGFSLSGQLPPAIFKNLTSLRTLSLRFNKLSGEFPDDLAACSDLRSLNLQGNRFTGEIPDSISSLKKLVRVSIANNNFSGGIPDSLSKLKRLKTLYLEDNQLSGFLPELKLNLDFFNVSNNRLNGSIPFSLRAKPESSFSGNRLCGLPLQICPGIAAGTGILTGEQKKKKKGLSGGAIAGIVIGSVLAFAIILMILVFVCGKKRSKQTNAVDNSSITKQSGVEIQGQKQYGEVENSGVDNEYSAAVIANNRNSKSEESIGASVSKKLVFFGNGVGGKMFDLEDLLRASAEVLGKGTFGTAYKAVLEVGTVVAVKRLKDVTISDAEFKEKIEQVGAMEHESLVPLRAYYYSRDEKLLVYEYMPMGSLSAFLHGNKGAGRTPLNWEMRSSIALGVARGITYLHSKGPDVSHGNIKSSNILLTKSHKARVSDFGLLQLVGPNPALNRANGYRAPEVTDPQRTTQKADVYSFGVLLLELLTGKAPNHTLLNEEGVDLPRWVRSIVKEDWTSEVFDLELLRYQHAEEEMVRLLELALDCASQHPDSRPSMMEVSHRIEELFGSNSNPSLNDLDDESSI